MLVEDFEAWLQCRWTRNNSPRTSHTAPLSVQNSPCSLEMARFGKFRACRANFVPLWPPTTRAGRTLYRIQGGCGASRTQPHTKCRRCGGCRSIRRAWLRCRWAVAGPGRASRRRAERSSRRGRLAGGPPPTAQPGPAGTLDTPKGRVPKYPPLTQPLPHRGSGRMTVSPDDGDASTGTCRQRRPLPGQPRRSDHRSPCAQDAEPHRYSGRWPEPQARRNRSSRQ